MDEDATDEEATDEDATDEEATDDHPLHHHLLHPYLLQYEDATNESSRRGPRGPKKSGKHCLVLYFNVGQTQELVGAGEPFEVVFVSSDKSAEELMAYMKVRFMMTTFHNMAHND